MRFLGKNGYDYQLAAALLVFQPDQVVTVSDISIGGWEHSISFEGIDGSFNGVMFEWLDAPSTGEPTPADGSQDEPRTADSGNSSSKSTS